MQNANLPEEVRPVVKKLGELAVQDALALLNQLAPTLKTDITTLKEVEAVTRQLTQIFGRTLAQGWRREIVQTREPSTPHCLKCAMTMRRVDYRSITKLGMFGTYQWRRAYYVCPADHGGLAPTDALLVLRPERFTTAVTALAVTLRLIRSPARQHAGRSRTRRGHHPPGGRARLAEAAEQAARLDGRGGGRRSHTARDRGAGCHPPESQPERTACLPWRPMRWSSALTGR